jgi:hypothetical protein
MNSTLIIRSKHLHIKEISKDISKITSLLYNSEKSNTKLNFIRNLNSDVNEASESKCTHNGPHGSRYHGQRGGGWCYWCYICNPSNPKSY